LWTSSEFEVFFFVCFNKVRDSFSLRLPLPAFQDTKQLVERMTDGGFLVPIQTDAKNKRGKKGQHNLFTSHRLFLIYLIPDAARGWTFVNNITQSNKLRTWFTPGGTLERNEFGVNAKVSAMSKSSVPLSLVAMETFLIQYILTPTYRLSLCGATDGQGFQELERRSTIRLTGFTVSASLNFSLIAFCATSGEGLRLIHFLIFLFFLFFALSSQTRCTETTRRKIDRHSRRRRSDYRVTPEPPDQIPLRVQITISISISVSGST
jgi:hypothetical protein